MFLTDEQVVELTGYKRPAEQRAWLIANHIRFMTSRTGRPRVLWITLQQRLNGRVTAQDEPNLKQFRPVDEDLHRKRT